MTCGNLENRIQVGDTVRLYGNRVATVTCLHSGNYDYEFSGLDGDGILIDFDSNEIREKYDNHS